MKIISGQHLSNMVQIGFMAGFHGEHQKAEVIFSGLKKIKPENVDITMGLAVTKISVGRIAEAIQMIETQVLDQQPDHTTAQCFLAWAYRLQGDSHRYSTIADEIHQSQNSQALALLASLQLPDDRLIGEMAKQSGNHDLEKRS